MAVTSFLNQKGGVGKTSTCFHLAGSLAKAGRRVLLLDNDPQASLTQGFWGPKAMYAIPAERSIAALYDEDDDASPARLITPTGLEGISIVPGSPALVEANMRPRREWSTTGVLRKFLGEVAEDFDDVLIDCPPNLHLCAYAALVASDGIVVPVQPEDFGAQGLGPVQDAIAGVVARPGSKLRLTGYLLTMVDSRMGAHATYTAVLREMYGAAVFEAAVPRAKHFVEAVMSRKPVGLHTPKSAAAKAIDAVAAELLARSAGQRGRAVA